MTIEFSILSIQISNYTPKSVLIVEDDQRLSELTKQYLTNNGLKADVVRDGALAANRILQDNPDIVVLDVMLPGENGLNICKKIRPHFKGSILMLTARNSDQDHIKGLELGADDYVAKPVHPRVLLARIKALLRRKAPEKLGSNQRTPTKLVFNALTIDSSLREAYLKGIPLELTSAEFDLLWLLTSNAGRILSREEIFEQIKGIEYDGQDRSIDVRISRIRPKIGDDPMNPHLIKTIRSKGYLFVDTTHNKPG